MFIWKIYFRGIFFGSVRATTEDKARRLASFYFGGRAAKYWVIPVYNVEDECEIFLTMPRR
jgi:hypothetical protein